MWVICGCGLIGVVFWYWMLCAGDLQLHTYVFVFNFVFGLDGCWSMLDGCCIYAHVKIVGYLYEV